VSYAWPSFTTTLTVTRRCEYILYRGVYRTSYARISRGIITDTELQVGQFMLPKHGHNVTDDSEPARYDRAFKEEMHPDLVSSVCMHSEDS
jgi:hypothetical protein